MSSGYDGSMHLRVFLSRVLYGSSGDRGWDAEVFDIPQVSWTDCKSLLDFLSKDGRVPSERRVALDIYDVQQYLTRDDMEWLPTGCQVADCLTKHFAAGEVNSLVPVLDGVFEVPAVAVGLPV